MPAPLLGIGSIFGRAAAGTAARGVAGAAGRGAVSGGIRGLIGRGLRGGAGEFITGKIGEGIKGIFGGNRTQETDQNIVPVNVSVVEGYASALKGGPPTQSSGGGGGAIVPYGSSSLMSRKTSAIVKSSKSNSIVEQLAALRQKIDQLIEIELAAKKSIEDQILRYVRDSEKNARSQEQKQQETPKEKSKVEKNPIVKQAKKAFGGIFDFIKELVFGFIQYKVLDWLSKPENRGKIEATLKFFSNLFKTLKTIFDIVLGPQLKLMGMLQSLIAGGAVKFFDFIGGVVNFFSLKWLPGFDGILQTIQNIPKIFTEMIPNAINGIINFFTKTLFGAAEEEGERAVSSAVGAAETGKTGSGETGSVEGQPPEQKSENFLGGAIQGLGKAVGNAFNATPIGIVGNFVKGMFGGGDKNKDNTPQLKKGGIVSDKKSEVSVKPLDDLANVAGIAGTMKKTVKMFMELLTMPFKLMGAAMITLVMNTVGRIPGVKLFLKPIIDNIISAFGLPPSIAKISEGSVKTTEQKKQLSKPEEKNTGQKSSGAVQQTIDQQTQQSDPTNKDTGSKVTQTASGQAGSGRMSQVAGTKEGVGITDNDRNRLTGQLEANHMEFTHENKTYKIRINPNNGEYTLYEKGGYGIGGIGLDKEIMIGGVTGPKKGGANEKLLQITHKNVQRFFLRNSRDKGLALKYLDKQMIENYMKTDEYKQDQARLKAKKEKKSKGGWITGPQSGYPVSLDGGSSVSFIGHGTEWVGFKKAAGGKTSSAFVIPYDTPATRSNGGLTQRRYKEAKSGGYHLPGFQGGGKVKTKPATSTSGERSTNKGTDKGKGSGGLPAVVSTGKLLLNKGFTVAEHPNFKKNNWSGKGPNTGSGYVSSGNANVGGHSSRSLHYKGLALDVTDWRPGDWSGRTKALAEEMYKNRNALKLTQIIHDPWGSWFAGGGKGGAIGGHPTHLHLGFASGPGAENVDLKSGDSSGSGGGSGGGGGTGGGNVSPPDQEESPIPTLDEVKKSGLGDLFKMLNPDYKRKSDPFSLSSSFTGPKIPGSSKLLGAQAENLITNSFNPASAASVSTSVINSPMSSAFNSSVASGENPLGNTLPSTGNWSIFKTNL